MEKPVYIGDCLRIEGEFIETLLEEGAEVQYDEFVTVIPEDILKEFFPDYKWRYYEDKYLHMKDDFAVRFYKFSGDEGVFYFVQEGGIEFVWEVDCWL